MIEQIVDHFSPNFAPDGQVLFRTDDHPKKSVLDETLLGLLGIPVGHTDSMPDLVVYRPDKDWLILLNSIDGHGPINDQRCSELATLFRSSTADLVYTSCFHSRAVIEKYVYQIAWETEV